MFGAPAPNPYASGVQPQGFHVAQSLVPSSLMTVPCRPFPSMRSQSDPSLNSTWTPSSPPLILAASNNPSSPHPQIHFWSRSSRFQGSGRAAIPSIWDKTSAPLLPSPAQLRIDRHKESKERCGKRKVQTERHTVHERKTRGRLLEGT